MRFSLIHALFVLGLARSGWALADETPSSAARLGLPASLADQEPPRPQEGERPNEFVIDINLWPILESHVLPTGERRTAFWPLFHFTTLPAGGVHSWHVLNFLKGPNYHMFLPLYYSIDEDFGILPPVLLGGSDYFASLPLLSGNWRYADGDQTTWITPLFHLTSAANGELRSLHAAFYFQGATWWTIPPALSGGWSTADGSDTLWITPLFHLTTDIRGDLDSLHAGIYFQGRNFWALPPLLTAGWTGDDGSRSTWISPLFHFSTDKDGDFAGLHAGPFFMGKDYWFLLPLAGSGTLESGGSTTWITPLFHLTQDKEGNVDSYHIGPYFEWKTWWMIPPLLSFGWSDGDDFRMTVGLFFCAHTDKEGLASTSLCPIFLYSRDDAWCIFPLLSGQATYSEKSSATWITPLFHLTTDLAGEVDSFHIGPYFEGKDYWAVPPLLSWQVKYADDVEALWLTPLFHLTTDKKGAESAHLFPAFFWERDEYWLAPPVLSAAWTSDNGDRNLWATPLFHWTTDKDGSLLDMHLGPYFETETAWGIPPLLTGGWQHPGGGDTTWVTPLFHLTTDAKGDVDSLHVGPYFQGENYWAIPPLLSWHYRSPDNVSSTWLTPAFHVTTEPDGSLRSAHLSPLWFWERDSYWVIPPLLTGGGRHADGAQSTWITPLFHQTVDKAGDLQSLHTFPLFFWKQDDYWTVPLLLSGGATHDDGSRETWITPLYHDRYAADGSLRARHLLTYFDGADYHHVVPLFWDWKSKDDVRHTMFAPPLFVRTEEENGDVTASLPWPLITYRSGKALDTSIGMELRPFVLQTAGDQLEFNFLWRMVSVLNEEESTRVMVGPFWHSERPHRDGALTKFQILGGLFARDCNYETERYRYRLLWIIPLGAAPMNQAP